MGFSIDNLKEFVLALLSSGFIGASFIIKKKGLRKATAVFGVRAGFLLIGVGGYAYLLEPLWWIGTITKEEMGFSTDNLKEFVLALLSSRFIGASFIIKKKGLRKATAVFGVRAGFLLIGVGGYAYLLEPFWWIGMITNSLEKEAATEDYIQATPATVADPEVQNNDI